MTSAAFNPVMSAAVAASWTVPEVAAARRKRYAATLQKAGQSYASIFSSVPQALKSIGVGSGVRTIRAAARDNAFVELEVNGGKYIIASLEISE